MFDEKTRSIEIKIGLHVKILNSKEIRDSDAPINDVLDYMEGDSNQTDDYVKKLQKILKIMLVAESGCKTWTSTTTN